jgi:hypothetical protein
VLAKLSSRLCRHSGRLSSPSHLQMWPRSVVTVPSWPNSNLPQLDPLYLPPRQTLQCYIVIISPSAQQPYRGNLTIRIPELAPAQHSRADLHDSSRSKAFPTPLQSSVSTSFVHLPATGLAQVTPIPSLASSSLASIFAMSWQFSVAVPSPVRSCCSEHRHWLAGSLCCRLRSSSCRCLPRVR